MLFLFCLSLCFSHLQNENNISYLLELLGLVISFKTLSTVLGTFVPLLRSPYQTAIIISFL